jgi:hypothetical protein
VKHCQPQEHLHVHVVRLDLQRLPQEHEHIGAARGDECTSLRVATGGTVQQHLHVEPEALANCPVGGGGGEKLVPSERSGVESRPLHGVRLPVVIRLAERLRPGRRVVLVEYDRRAHSRWVPYPIPLLGCRSWRLPAGLSTPEVRAKRPSAYGGDLYVAAATRTPDLTERSAQGP